MYLSCGLNTAIIVKKLIILLFILTFTLISIGNTAFAVEKMKNVGVGYFGIQSKRWHCDASYTALKDVKNIHLAFIWKTFGNNTRCLRKFLKDRRTKTLEVHFLNGPGLWNKRLQSHEIMYGESLQSVIKKLENNDKKFLKGIGIEAALLSNYLTDNISFIRTQCLVDPMLENRLTYKAGNNLYAYLRPILPKECKLVWNPVGGNSKTIIKNADLVENHGKDSILLKNSVTNLDGHDISFHSRKSLMPFTSFIYEDSIASYLIERSKSLVNFLWILEFNGNCQGGGFTNPLNRTCFPNKNLFDSVGNLIRKSQKLPVNVPEWSVKDDLSKVGCKSYEKAIDGDKTGFLWKSSEAYNGKVAVLLPSKFTKQFKTMTVVKEGRVINTLKFATFFSEDGSKRQIWRSQRVPTDFPYNVVLHVDSMCYVLHNPKGRID